MIAVLAAGAALLPLQAIAEVDALQVRLSGEYGRFLVDATGRALYLFTADTQGQGEQAAESACQGGCASAWPPATATEAPAAREEVRADLIGMIDRQRDPAALETAPPAAVQQVTYNGWPLYYFAADRGQGSSKGQDVKTFGGEWYLVTPAGQPVGHDGEVLADVYRDADFQGPECLRFDIERNRYLVSNINGKMLDKDNNGFISALAPDGTVIARKWISADTPGVTLNAPKGMEIAGGELHVADIDTLRTFDLETGQALRDIRIEGATFLNDLTAAPDGTLYVTDTGSKDVPGAIYRVAPGGEVAPIASGRDLHRPNGIDMDEAGNLIVVTFGGDSILTVTTDGEITGTQTLDAGKLDGLVVRPGGTRLVASWDGKHIVRVSPDGTQEVVLTNVASPAAFDVDTERNRLLVPLVQQNRIEVAPLGE